MRDDGLSSLARPLHTINLTMNDRLFNSYCFPSIYLYTSDEKKIDFIDIMMTIRPFSI